MGVLGVRSTYYLWPNQIKIIKILMVALKGTVAWIS